MNDYIKKIRESSQSSKQMIIVGISVVLCAVFFAGWTWYMKSITAIPDETSDASMVVPDGISFGSTLRSGLADIGHSIGGIFKGSKKSSSMNRE